MTGRDDDRKGAAQRRTSGGWGGKLIIALLMLEAFAVALYFGGYWGGAGQANGASQPVTVSGAGGYVPDLGVNPASAAADVGADGAVAPSAADEGTFHTPAG